MLALTYGSNPAGDSLGRISDNRHLLVWHSRVRRCYDLPSPVALDEDVGDASCFPESRASGIRHAIAFTRLDNRHRANDAHGSLVDDVREKTRGGDARAQDLRALHAEPARSRQVGTALQHSGSRIGEACTSPRNDMGQSRVSDWPTNSRGGTRTRDPGIMSAVL